MKKIIISAMVVTIMIIVTMTTVNASELPPPIHYCTQNGITLDFGTIDKQGHLTVNAFGSIYKFATPYQVVIETGVYLIQKDETVSWSFTDKHGKLHTGNWSIPITDFCNAVTVPTPQPECSITVAVENNDYTSVMNDVYHLVLNGNDVGFVNSTPKKFTANCGDNYLKIGKLSQFAPGTMRVENNWSGSFRFWGHLQILATLPDIPEVSYMQKLPIVK